MDMFLIRSHYSMTSLLFPYNCNVKSDWTDTAAHMGNYLNIYYLYFLILYFH